MCNWVSRQTDCEEYLFEVLLSMPLFIWANSFYLCCNPTDREFSALEPESLSCRFRQYLPIPVYISPCRKTQSFQGFVGKQRYKSTQENTAQIGWAKCISQLFFRTILEQRQPSGAEAFCCYKHKMKGFDRLSERWFWEIKAAVSFLRGKINALLWNISWYSVVAILFNCTWWTWAVRTV